MPATFSSKPEYKVKNTDAILTGKCKAVVPKPAVDFKLSKCIRNLIFVRNRIVVIQLFLRKFTLLQNLLIAMTKFITAPMREEH